MTEEEQRTDLKRGLPMVRALDPEAAERDKAELERMARLPTLSRWAGYWRRIGPGWLQSALTLGGGSAGSSLFAGALFGYQLLWVQPVAMLLGIIMMSAIAYQTLSTRARPFDAMKAYVHPTIAWAWALGSLAATLIWHFPQYALAGAVVQDMADLAGAAIPTWPVGLVILVLATAITWSYGRGIKGIRLYERLLRYMVWLIVISFALVVIRTGVRDWGELLRGYFTFHIPRDPRGVSVMMGAFGAAVGINMTFLFPYTLLARGWGRNYRGLARFDLMTGMLLPFVLATSLMIIATANTLPGTVDIPATGISLPAKSAAQALAPLAGPFFARVIFNLGVLGMVLSTITLHMLASAFIICEMLNWEPVGWRYRLASLVIAPGMLGTVLWKNLLWVAVPTSAICGVLLPIAYIAFLVLHNRRAYMGDAKPVGTRAWLWNLGMIAAVVASASSAGYFIYTAVPDYLSRFAR
ncbi:MAG: divalent metal cation transporter [Armatimonadota bacterium]|nr:MAG: divalent metal cation transporter [Armatimonadota bacterium]